MTGIGLITAALREIRVVGAVDVPADADADLGLRILNRIVDGWNAVQAAMFGDALASYPTTPGLSPHTIGPAPATWACPLRPVAVQSLAILDGSGFRRPITIHDRSWYLALTNPSQAGDPTDAYLASQAGATAIYFWPVPASALTIEIGYRGGVAAFDLTTDVTLPPGYQAAFELTLAVEAAPAFGAAAQLAPTTVTAAGRARGVIWGNNNPTPRMGLDAGIPGCRTGGWDVRTGTVR